MKFLVDWLDSRTGCRKLFKETLFENVPGGSRWRYVWGSTLTFALAVQFITGLFLWMSYSPSAQTAWESVYFIQYEMFGGWFLRGLHHYTAQVMTVLLVLHLMQVVIDGAYKAPREVNFWFGLILLQLVLALSLTGYLLPWDQKGFWATNVATNLMGIVPVIGPDLQKAVIGGTDYGHHTLTRFFALHAGVLPGLVIALVVGHIYLFRKHGICSKKPHRKPDAAFWPDQVLKDAVACLAVLATVMLLILRHWILDREAGLGASLGAPADPSEPYSAARPDWYFLFLFQMLKYFSAEQFSQLGLPYGEHAELIGAILLPGAILGLIFIMPFLGRWKLGHVFNLGVLSSLLVGFGLLTYLAIAADKSDAMYLEAVADADRNAARVKMLAQAPTGIPTSGAVTLLRKDPLTQGPLIFAENCASCHRYGGHDGTGKEVADAQSAPDLKDFASRNWLKKVLTPEGFGAPQYFGGTAFTDGKMQKWLNRHHPKFSDDDKENWDKLIVALSAEAEIPYQAVWDQADADVIEEGKALIEDEFSCIDCHEYHFPDEEATAPTLTGYGSREWLIEFISDPEKPHFYGDRNDRMPKFLETDILDAEKIGLVVDWLRGDWYGAEAGEVATAE